MRLAFPYLLVILLASFFPGPKMSVAAEPRGEEKAEELLRQGILLGKAGSLDDAIRTLTESIRIKASAIAYYCRGQTYALKGDYEHTIADCNEAIRIEPKYAAAYQNRSLAYLVLGEYAKSIENANALLALEPGNAKGYTLRAMAYGRMHELDKSLTDANKALDLKPGDEYALGWRASVYMFIGSIKAALADCATALKSNPHYCLPCIIRAAIYAHQGDCQGAIGTCKQAIHKDPKYVDAYIELSWLLATCPDKNYRNGKTALEYASRARDVAKVENWSVLMVLAASHAECGHFDKAVKLSERSLEIAPPSEKEALRVTLNLYKSKKPFRQKGNAIRFLGSFSTGIQMYGK
jgi:tetratricopeptide (TPR) repeat protein